MKVCDICEQPATKFRKGQCDSCYFIIRRGGDPYVDEVAVQRSLEGDRKVYERLTRRERGVVLDRLAVKYWRARAEDEFHFQLQREHVGGWGDEPLRTATGLVRSWCEDVGEDPGRVLGLLRGRAKKVAA